ncbi:MAG: hypothetical protein HYS59_01680 [Candidatus Vogelbacteria bacterium]|nr:hypothetical protein [Candidatus Vogelbacteria bacterium]
MKASASVRSRSRISRRDGNILRVDPRMWTFYAAYRAAQDGKTVVIAKPPFTTEEEHLLRYDGGFWI